MTRHPFAFTTAYRVAALPFGVTPRSAWAEVSGGLLRVRFGPWRLHTPLSNLARVSEAGGYSFFKTAGPARLSLADRGITFATNARGGVCLEFHEPVRVDAPVGHVRCPNLSLTPAEPDKLLRDLKA